ncbi:MAG TPA: response regulator transcription factor [Candidatus Melainabacteria bacterium]|jgi:two-component system, NarL family, response regulator LiaR|nr:response regulator transcription factor [Candidatus Melainabacteria bacterium]HIN67145.1 response regulator transcription factor [Candidatus Obscuribacterales bacterium]
MPKPKILIVDDDANLRAGLKELFEQSDVAGTIFEAADGMEALTLDSRYLPDLILLDVGMPMMDGIEACSALKKRRNDLKIIMLTSHEDDRDIFAALAAGANGYCLKDADFNRLEAAVNAVICGDLWLDSSIAQKVLSALPTPKSKTNQRKAVYAELSDRETQVLHLIVDGFSNQQIAEKLEISKETVKTHVRHLMDKLAVSDRTQAAVKALRYGLVSSNEPHID